MTPYLGSKEVGVKVDAGYRLWFPDIGSLLSNISFKEHHKLDSSVRLLLIMWACVSPCWCGCCNLALPVVLFAE